MPASKATQALVAHRRSEMLLMKIQGKSAIEIAEHFHISPGTARSDLHRATKKAKKLEVQNAELYRYIQGARLETLLRSVLPLAIGAILEGEEPSTAPEVDLKANEQARKIIADISDLFGLKVPVRTELTGANGGPLQMGPATAAELEVLMGLGTGLLGPGTDEDDDEEDQPDSEEDEEDGSAP